MNPLRTRAGQRWVVVGALGLVVAAYAAVVIAGLDRPGYSIDEEFTYFAVRGISERGIPILPSGALENRGLPYTYAAWLAGALFGHGFPSYRLPSLICGVISLVFLFRFASLAQPRLVAVITVVAVALLPWQIFSAQWARFYSMFLACTLWSLWLYWRYLKSQRGLGLWLASVALAHLLHDFAILLVVLPIVAAVLERDRQQPARPVRVTLLAAATFAGIEVALVALHMATSAEPFRTLHGYSMMHAAPIAWETFGDPLSVAAPGVTPALVERFFAFDAMANAAPLALVGLAVGAISGALLGVGRVFGCAAGTVAGLTQFGRCWFLAAMWAFSRPRMAGRIAIWAVMTVIATSIAMAVQVSWTRGATLSIPFVQGMVTFALKQVTSLVWGPVQYYPLATVCFGVAGVALAIRDRSRPLRFARILFLWVMAWLLAFDVLGVEFKPRYYVPLWPLVALAAMQLPRTIPASWFPNLRVVGIARVAAALVVLSVFGWEHHTVADENRRERCVAGDAICVPEMVSYDAPDLVTLSGEIKPADVVLCTDELLCHLLIGRIDYWLYTGTIFSYPSDRGATGLYGGAPIVRNVADLQAIAERHPDARFWIIFPTFRKYPSWTPEQVFDALPPPLGARLQRSNLPSATVFRPAGL